MHSTQQQFQPIYNFITSSSLFPLQYLQDKPFIKKKQTVTHTLIYTCRPFRGNTVLHVYKRSVQAYVIGHYHKWLYVDDVNLVGDTGTLTAGAHVQLDLDAINKWSEENLLPMTFPKCAALHYRQRTLNCQYTTFVSMQQITAVEQCMDLDVMRNRSFSYDVYIRNVALKATRLVGMALKAFSTRNIDFMVKIFATYIRTVLKYASVVWSPSSVALNDQTVSRSYTTGMVTGLKYASISQP